jgi:hypothetical protein
MLLSWKFQKIAGVQASQPPSLKPLAMVKSTSLFFRSLSPQVFRLAFILRSESMPTEDEQRATDRYF